MALPGRSIATGREATALKTLAALPSPPPADHTTALVYASFFHASKKVERAARKAARALLGKPGFAAIGKVITPLILKNLRRRSEPVHRAWLLSLEAAGLDLSELAPLLLEKKKLGALLCWERGYIDDLRMLRHFRSGNTLTLSGSGLTAIPDAIGQLTGITRLLACELRLTAVPATIAALRKLEVLDLRGNQLTALPFSLSTFPALRSLHISSSPLSALPDGLAECTGLKELYLSGPALTTATVETICTLPALETLNLSRTDLDTLPDAMGRLTALRYFYLFETKVRALPASLGTLPHLSYLSVSFTPLREIPDEVLDLPSLKLFSITRTGLSRSRKDALRARLGSRAGMW